MYTVSSANVYGTEAEHLTAIKNLLINNDVAPWTLVSQNMSCTEGVKNGFTVSLGNCRLTVESDCEYNSDTDYSYKAYFSLANGAYEGDTANVQVKVNDGGTRLDNANRYMKLLLAKRGNTVLLTLSGYQQAAGTVIGCPLLIKADLGSTEIASADVVSFSDAEIEFHKTSDGSENYFVAPCHDAVTENDKLILDSDLPVKDDSGAYMTNTLANCYGLGGGETGKFYQGTNNDLLFCFTPNCCIKL